MSSRLKDYAAQRGPAGQSTQKNIDFWSKRASANSDGDKHRGYDGEMRLPNTKVSVRDTEMRPKVSRSVEATIKAARADKNDVGSTYLPNVRRTTT